jgi:hypothetical protein
VGPALPLPGLLAAPAHADCQGAWSRILLFGRPQIEYICPYGHGTLREDDLHISGLSAAEWTPNSDDMWAELCAPGKDSDRV